MKANAYLSYKGCVRMVNEIINAKTPEEIRKRCKRAKKNLQANVVIDSLQYRDLLTAINFLYRKSYDNE